MSDPDIDLSGMTEYEIALIEGWYDFESSLEYLVTSEYGDANDGTIYQYIARHRIDR